MIFLYFITEGSFYTTFSILSNTDTALENLKNNKNNLEAQLSNLNNNKNDLITQKENIELSIKNLEEQLKLADQTTKDALTQQIKTLKTNLTQIDNGISNVNTRINEINENLKLINNNINNISELIKNKNSIEVGFNEIIKQENELQNKIASTKKEIQSAKNEIYTGKNEIEINESKLVEKETEANQKITDAQNELDNAKKEVEKIKKPEWYILDRNSNRGFSGYAQDSERLENIGKVFPIVFFVVAALMSLTSMTRMVEEQRGLIGTYKSLGYNKLQIANKYLIYSSLATIFGSFAGMAIGFKILPNIIFNMYSMMYTVTDLITEFNFKYGIIGLIIAFGCTVGSTAFSIVKELNRMPAALMRPKAPKPGKKVILEKIDFIWNKLKFTQKVTVRNVFRYKKRFLMTIIGICGSTSLIVAGFGLRDSISSMIPKQYGEIYKYQMETSLKENTSNEQVIEIENQIKQIDGVISNIKINKQSGKITNNSGDSQDIQIFVVENEEQIKDFITLKNPNKKEEYKLDNNSIIITEKLSKLLDIKENNKIIIENFNEEKSEIEVSKITENYIMHFAYMTKDVYEKIFNEKIEYNSILTITNEMTKEEENQIAQNILENDNVSSNTFTSITKEMFDETMQNLNSVVIVLIISAGLLAIVVLYNLANVNISERVRELATIKVLGFYDKEVYKYVARETIILTIIGIFVGLVVGYFLTLFVITTCELDLIVFEKRVHPQSYLYAAVLTGMFTLMVNIATYFTLKKIDMIESLKSIE